MNKAKFETQRSNNQTEVASFFTQSSSDQIFVIESPTGSGKTHIALKSAFEYKDKYDSAVIISTNTNKNAFNTKASFVKHLSDFINAKDSDLVVEIGKSNYIDLEILVDTLQRTPSVFSGTGISIEAIEKNYLADNQILRNDILLEDFIDQMNIKENDVLKFLSFAQDVDKTISPKDLYTFFSAIEEKKVIVTNHAFLFIIYRMIGSGKISNYKNLLFKTPLVLDEFHTFFDSAKSVLTKTFSLFRLKYSIDGLLKHIDESNNKVHIKRLKNIMALIIEAEAKIKNIENLSKQDAIKEKTIETISWLKTNISLITNMEQTTKKLSNIENLDRNYELEQYIRFTKNELEELMYINLRNTDKIKISFSPKGYPSVILDNKYPTYEIRKILWSRNTSRVLCLSGTLRTKDSTMQDSYKWCIDRNGLFKNELSDEYLNFIKDDEQKELLEKANELTNQRIDSIFYKTYHSLFDKSNFLYTIVAHEEITRPREMQNYIEEIPLWRKNIGIFVANNMQYNTLVLTTSYDDVEEIANKVKELRPEVEIFSAKQGGEPMPQLVKKYQKATENPNQICCLIGTEQYYTGLDLPGEQLQEVYLANIPFSPPKGEIGGKIIHGLGITKTENYINKTLMKFAQGVGRPIRGYEDTAVLYILDGRINNPKYTDFKNIIDKKGIKTDYRTLNAKYKMPLLGKKENIYQTSIYTLFFSYFIDKSLPEIKNLLNIEEHEIEEVSKICIKILDEDINIEQIFSKEEFFTILKENKHKNIWTLLLRIYSTGMKRKGIDIEAIIRKNNMFGKTDMKDISKTFFEMT